MAQSPLLSASDVSALINGQHSEPARTQALVQTLKTCRRLWQNGATELDAITEQLGNASRDEAWRLPLGESGILDFYFSVLAVDVPRSNLHVHALRLIGNSCADTDENRERVVQGHHLPTIVRCLNVDALVPYAIPVLYNIVVDYEPAQIAASQALVTSRLLDLFTTAALPALTPLLHFLPKLLSLLVSHPCERDVAPPNTPSVLLSLALGPLNRVAIDDFIGLVAVAASYLAGPAFQQALVSSPQEFSLFLSTYEHVNAIDLPALQAQDPDAAQQVTSVRVALLNLLADMSAFDIFLSYHAAEGPVVQTLKGWLAGPNVAAGCLALGNIARSDEMAVAVVQQWEVHTPLIALLSDQAVTDSQVLHAAMGFLKNLALPASNKPVLGANLLKGSCVPRFYTMDVMPQIQFMAVSLTRLLLVNCPSNVAELCEQLAPEPALGVERGPSPKVNGLLSVFERSDAEPTKLEAARAVAGICRVLHSTPNLPFVLPGWDHARQAFIKSSHAPTEDKGVTPGDRETEQADSVARQSFYDRQDLRAPLRYLIAQSKWPILRSEAWFVFALMSRSSDGAKLVLGVLAEPVASGSLVEAVTGQSGLAAQPLADDQAVVQTAEGVVAGQPGTQLELQEIDPQQKENMARVDRENAVVLCTELLKSQGGNLPAAQHKMLQDLVMQGTQHIAGGQAGLGPAIKQ